MPPETMRAVRYERYGPPEVLKIMEVPRPTPGPGQVLVKVHATSVNPFEIAIRSGSLRLLSGFRFPKGTGTDFAGEVAGVGSGVDESLLRQRVWGLIYGLTSSTAAEYILVKERRAVPAPTKVDLVKTAALPMVGLTALEALRIVGLRAQQRLLVVGASGGVGSAVVQLASAKGIQVAAVSSAANADFCSKLGSAETYDYKNLETLSAATPFDGVVDLHGASLDFYRKRLRSGGKIVSFATKGIGAALTTIVRPGPSVRIGQVKANRAAIEELTKLIERDELRPVIDEIYPMDSIVQAHRAVESGHGRGKRVLQII